jgi:hypothetical protein
LMIANPENAPTRPLRYEIRDTRHRHIGYWIGELKGAGT